MKSMRLQEKIPLWKARLEQIGSGKKRALLIMACVAALLLLVLSEWTTGRTKPTSAQTQQADCAAELEAKLSSMLGAIDGAGETKVLVTLKNGSETVWARNDKTDTDSTHTLSEQE